MQAFLITTTGLQNPVVLSDLGYRRIPHPTTNYNLASEYSIDEIVHSGSIQNALDFGYITATYNGISITSSISLADVAGGDMYKSDYDTDNDLLPDKAESLNDGVYSVTAQEARRVVDSFKSGSGNPNGIVSGMINDNFIDTLNGIVYRNIDGTITGWIVV